MCEESKYPVEKYKVYRKGNDVLPTIDSTYVANEFAEASTKIANHISCLDVIRNKLECIHHITSDNFDVAFGLSEAIEKLGLALASCVTYADEYRKESNNK